MCLLLIANGRGSSLISLGKYLLAVFLVCCFSFLIFSPSPVLGQPTLRVLNGSGSGLKQSPGLVSLVERGTPSSYWGHFCAGTLIRPRWVLTAAHCVDYADKIDVVAGRVNLRSKKGKRLAVLKIFKHPYYQKHYSDDYDFALLYLDRRLKRKKAVIEKNAPLPGSTLTVFGWGAKKYNFPARLHKGKVLLFDNSLCRNFYQEEFSSESMFCALGRVQKGFATDTCRGDSGGPAFYRGKLVGVTSFGENCGVKPGVYGRVYAARPWVLKRVSAKPLLGKKARKIKPGPDNPFAPRPKPEAVFFFTTSQYFEPDGDLATDLFLSVDGNLPIHYPRIQVFGQGALCVLGRCYKNNQTIRLKKSPGGRSAETEGVVFGRNCSLKFVFKLKVGNLIKSSVERHRC